MTTPPDRRRPWLLAGIVVLALVLAALVVLRLRAPRPHAYVTAPVRRATLVATVTAEGTVNPQNLILVGTQVSGTVSEIDVDYNSPVRAGQRMARIDPTSLRDVLAQQTSAQRQYELAHAAGIS